MDSFKTTTVKNHGCGLATRHWKTCFLGGTIYPSVTCVQMLLHIYNARCSRLCFILISSCADRSILRSLCRGITQEQINMTSFNWQRSLRFPACRKSWQSIRYIVLFRALFRPLCSLLRLMRQTRQRVNYWFMQLDFFAGDVSPLYGGGADERNLHRSPPSSCTYIIYPPMSQWSVLRGLCEWALVCVCVRLPSQPVWG